MFFNSSTVLLPLHVPTVMRMIIYPCLIKVIANNFNISRIHLKQYIKISEINHSCQMAKGAPKNLCFNWQSVQTAHTCLEFASCENVCPLDHNGSTEV